MSTATILSTVLPNASSAKGSLTHNRVAQFEYKSNGTAQQVIVTGEFDNWSQSIKMKKETDGSTFTARVPLADTVQPGDKIMFKFVVDGVWKTSSSNPIQDDGNGNENNVFTFPQVNAEPEAPVLLCSPASTAAVAAAAESMSATLTEKITLEEPAEKKEPFSEKKSQSTLVPTVASIVVEEQTVKVANEAKKQASVEEKKAVLTAVAAAPLVEKKDATPVIEKKDVTSLVEEKSVTPLAETKAITPLVEAKAVTPLAETKAITPLVEAKAVTPLAETKAITPLVEAKAVTPLVETKVITPLVEAKAVTPLVEKRHISAEKNVATEQPASAVKEETSNHKSTLERRPTPVPATTAEVISARYESIELKQSAAMNVKESLAKRVSGVFKKAERDSVSSRLESIEFERSSSSTPKPFTPTIQDHVEKKTSPSLAQKVSGVFGKKIEKETVTSDTTPAATSGSTKTGGFFGKKKNNKKR